MPKRRARGELMEPESRRPREQECLGQLQHAAPRPSPGLRIGATHAARCDATGGAGLEALIADFVRATSRP